MSDFVTIAGTYTLKIFENTATELPPDLKGNEQAIDDNTLQNSQRDPKRKFACVGKFDPPSDYDTFLAAISVTGQLGVPTPVPVISAADGITRGASLSMWVRVGEIKIVSKGAGLFKTTKLSVPLAFREA